MNCLKEKKTIFMVIMVAVIVIVLGICLFNGKETQQVMEGTLVHVGARI